MLVSAITAAKAASHSRASTFGTGEWDALVAALAERVKAKD
jgi:hypothetical protein